MEENDILVNNAYEWACQRATEEGDVDIECDYSIIEAWMEEYINEHTQY